MAKGRTVTVTSPDGQTYRRTSAGHVYTHAAFAYDHRPGREGWFLVGYSSSAAGAEKAARSFASHGFSRPTVVPVSVVGGQARNRGGRTLAEERLRRIFDAQHQPRTPLTRQRFWFVPVHRKPPPRRRPLDAESRRWYEERDLDLVQSIEGLKYAIAGIRDEIADDKYDAGIVRDQRHYFKGRKAFTPTGRRVKGYEVTAATPMRAARARIRDLNDELRAARTERKEIADVMRHGELPGHYRKRLAQRRRRR